MQSKAVIAAGGSTLVWPGVSRETAVVLRLKYSFRCIAPGSAEGPRFRDGRDWHAVFRAADRQENGIGILKKPLSAEEAEAEKRERFAVRANSILAFIECNEDQRPKLREAIVEAMLWAQTQA